MKQNTIVRLDDIKTLANEQHSLCISLYLPTQESGPECRQNPIRFKNLLTRVEQELQALDRRDREIQTLLKPARQLLEESPFWNHQRNSLAAFLTPATFQYFRLPAAFPEIAIAANEFHITPLCSLLPGNHIFYILALNQKHLRFFKATRYQLDPIELEGLPVSIDEFTSYGNREKELQIHSGSPPRSSDKKRTAVFHGQGAGENAAKVRQLHYFQLVNKHIHKYLQHSRSPLVVVGGDSLLPVYRDANTYPHLAAQSIAGNPEDWSNDEFHAAAWEIVAPIFDAERKEAMAQYHQQSHSEQGRASKRLREIVPAAFYGRVETLFVAIDKHHWGTFDPDTDTATLHQERQPGESDLLNMSAIQTILHGGTVYADLAAQLPEASSISAIFRHS